MKFWITVYALSKGIIETEGELIGHNCIRLSNRAYVHGEGKNWHYTKEEAELKARSMRSNKIASLKKQLAKIEALKF